MMNKTCRFAEYLQKYSFGTLFVVLSCVAWVLSAGFANGQAIEPAPHNTPAMWPEENTLVISSTSSTGSYGIVSIIDYSGDTLMSEQVMNGYGAPLAVAVDSTGANAYVLTNSNVTAYFPISQSLTSNMFQYWLSPSFNANLVNLFAPPPSLYAMDTVDNSVYGGGYPPNAYSEEMFPGTTPVTMAGSTGSYGWYYAVTQGIPYGTTCNTSPSTASSTGEAGANETGYYTISAYIPLGRCPVYAVTTDDGQRTFVLNRGSDNITVLTGYASLDTCASGTTNQSGQLVKCPVNGLIPVLPTVGYVHAGPVYAEYNAKTSKLIVANYDGNSVSIIDVSRDMYGNDSPTFGQSFTVSVGSHPAGLTVLPDGTRAYVANQGDGSISIIDLRRHVVVKTTTPESGHPRSVVSIASSATNSIHTKIYLAEPDISTLAVISDSTGSPDSGTPLQLYGNIVDVKVTAQVAGSGQNSNFTSRMPGAGQPCNLPNLSPASIAACQALQ